MFINNSGVINEISTSKIKNIIITIRKFVENDVFFITKFLNPHSNDDFFFIKLSVLLIIIANKSTKNMMIIIRFMIIRLINIDLYSF